VAGRAAGRVNFVSGARGFTAASGGLLNNNAKTQGFLIGNVINF
jgi:hypothetical protein